MSGLSFIEPLPLVSINTAILLPRNKSSDHAAKDNNGAKDNPEERRLADLVPLMFRIADGARAIIAFVVVWAVRLNLAGSALTHKRRIRAQVRHAAVVGRARCAERFLRSALM